MKKLAICSVVLSLSVLGLSGCTPGHNTGGATFAGAAAGGLIGGALFNGGPGGVIAGALIGGIVGNQIGQSMDRQDRANMSSAITTTPVGSQAQWRNERTDTTYVVKPVSQSRKHGRYCREYQTTVTVGGKERRAYGKACRKPDGSWKIVK